MERLRVIRLDTLFVLNILTFYILPNRGLLKTLSVLRLEASFSLQQVLHAIDVVDPQKDSPGKDIGGRVYRQNSVVQSTG